LQSHPIAACLDFISPHKVDKLGVAPTHYFNAGMLLMDLDAMRAMGFNEIVVAGFNDKNRIFAHDQDFLNLIFKNNWKRVHSRWNVVIHHSELRSRRLRIYDYTEFRDALANPGIIHYTGTKPSVYLHDSEFKQLYWFYLAMTPYRDYRYPKPRLAQIARKWRKRLKRRTLEMLAGVH
jgi:lipopolysaccharide biosynthesis glycosyltransferase